MAISSSDLVQYQSAGSGSSGGAITGSSITSGVDNNVWPNVTDAQRIAGIVLGRKTFWKNNHATDPAVKPVIWCRTPPVNATLVLGLGVNSSDDADIGQGNMSALSAPALIYAESDTGGDTRVLTIFGLDNSGPPVPVTETVALNGTVPVAFVNTYSKVYAVWAASTDAGRVITIRQGIGGTVRGTIAASKKICWLWVNASSKGAGIALPNLNASQSYGLWRRLTVAAGAGAVRPDGLTVGIEENA